MHRYPNKAMILAAGEGKRLRPLTEQIPKPLVPLCGKPIIEHIIEMVKVSGIKDIMINLYYLPEHIKHFCNDGAKWDVNISYSPEPELYGSARSVKMVHDYFDGSILVVLGDNYYGHLELKKFFDFHSSHSGICSVAFFKSDNPESGGIARIDEDGKILEFVEKPRKKQIISNWCNSGIYILEPEIFSYIPEECYFDFGLNLFPLLINKSESLFAYKLPGNVMGIDTLDLYENAKKELEQDN